MGDKRQNIQLELAFMAEVRREALRRRQQGTESPVAGSDTERPTVKGPTLEAVVERQNLLRALQRVRNNKGKPGPDGMTVEQLPGYLKTHWPQLKQQLLSGTYQPQPVRRVLIPKNSGGQRPLGIPTVVSYSTSYSLVLG